MIVALGKALIEITIEEAVPDPHKFPGVTVSVPPVAVNPKSRVLTGRVVVPENEVFVPV